MNVESLKNSKRQLNLNSAELRAHILAASLVRHHRNTMLFICLFHVLVAAVVLALTCLNLVRVVEDNLFCHYAYTFKNVGYFLFNVIVIMVSLQSIRSIKQINHLPAVLGRSRVSLMGGLLLCPIIILVSVAPEYVCHNVSIDLKNALVMTGHVLLESIFLMVYFSWIRKIVTNLF